MRTTGWGPRGCALPIRSRIQSLVSSPSRVFLAGIDAPVRVLDFLMPRLEFNRQSSGRELFIGENEIAHRTLEHGRPPKSLNAPEQIVGVLERVALSLLRCDLKPSSPMAHGTLKLLLFLAQPPRPCC